MTTTITRKPTILTWQGVASPRLESVRLLVADSRLKASGRIIAAASDDGPAFSASLEATTDQVGAFGRLLIRATTAEDECQISVTRTKDGLWLVDRGSGSERGAFGGSMDVDVEGAVLFNCLAIRRLGLHKEAGSHELPVVHVSLPTLTVNLMQKTYTTVSIGDDMSVVNYKYGSIDVDLTVDSNGLVIDYPGFAQRV
ncbi:putative glycolipid-binding domain-containing protein [Kibdelosporangium philippinense]|uniref:Glycolipid-binding domain-containing protein n=1 Tax=Kibdelosporangium philippinense TaxID=211113 RepID=A0ABS8ZP07_9PSEU|nr:putative glycolipid-binding domain-containing protein [Kibdelosporangium philippinense]MCE7009455.1 putative glycolipid-binding domain-containing protein [Kibdelosporangium philippinense]